MFQLEFSLSKYIEYEKINVFQFDIKKDAEGADFVLEFRVDRDILNSSNRKTIKMNKREKEKSNEKFCNEVCQ